MAEVNLNVAMESTSQEILEKIEDVNSATSGKPVTVLSGIITISKLSSEATMNLVSVTGKGKFCFAGAYTDNIGSTTVPYYAFKITVDGVCILDVKHQTTASSSNGATIVVYSPKWLKGGSSYNSFLPTNYNTNMDGIEASPLGQFITPSGEQQIVDTITSYPLSCMFSDDIPFAESLEVEYSHGGNLQENHNYPVSYTVGYALD